MADELPALSQPVGDRHRPAAAEHCLASAESRQGQGRWQQRYARVEGLRKLVQRYLEEARAAADKREQKLLDELAQRLPQRDDG